MTHLRDDPTRFREEMLAGFVASYGRYVRRVPGASGVMRADSPRAGKVAVVVGGGSGHYPAFCGLVGPGLADAAVVGEVFTSPSAEQAYRVAAAVDGGAGVLFTFGNYAGDVMNFGAAGDRLNRAGVPCRTVLVTDDVASGPRDKPELRRGIAGGLFVFKAAAAAAERGLGLAEVERVARKANDHTRTVGVAFAGCTLPGQRAPLFEVSPGLMEVGLGIHGEAGVETAELVDSRRLAGLMVGRLLEERPSGGSGRVALLLNGLGATKYEEMFVLAHPLLQELETLGLEVVLPEAGELVTSLDMAGCSLSLMWLDDELEELWTAPADSPGFRRPATGAPAAVLFTAAAPPVHDDTVSADVGAGAAPVMPAAAGPAADAVRHALHAIRETLILNEELLSRLDAAAGDGDHGSGMVRGARAATEAADRSTGDAASVLTAAGDAWADGAGGTSGMLWGGMLRAAGAALRDAVDGPGPAASAAVDAAVAEVVRLGRAEPGDKTLLDSLVPLADSLRGELARGAGLAEAWACAARVASTAAADTAALTPRVGRARPLAERSVGVPDPGATSLALCATVVGETILAQAGVL